MQIIVPTGFFPFLNSSYPSYMKLRFFFPDQQDAQQPSCLVIASFKQKRSSRSLARPSLCCDLDARLWKMQSIASGPLYYLTTTPALDYFFQYLRSASSNSSESTAAVNHATHQLLNGGLSSNAFSETIFALQIMPLNVSQDLIKTRVSNELDRCDALPGAPRMLSSLQQELRTRVSLPLPPLAPSTVLDPRTTSDPNPNLAIGSL